MQTSLFADFTALIEAHGDEHAADLAAEFCHAFGGCSLPRLPRAAIRRMQMEAQSQSLQAPRSTTSWWSTRTPNRAETRLIARSSTGSSNATNRPQRSHTRW